MGRLKRILELLLPHKHYTGGTVSGPVPEMFPDSNRITGSFDRVEVDYELPIYNQLEKEWQTQNFNCENDLYFISRFRKLYKTIGDDATPILYNGYIQIINVIKRNGKDVYVKVELALTAGKVDGVTRIMYDYATSYNNECPNTKGKYF